MVASQIPRSSATLRVYCSIPFIAGQWSLLSPPRGGDRAALRVQSPSLRGSGRFSRRARLVAGVGRGSSIPFIAGQWSLLVPKHGRGRRPRHVQSPSLRGSGRFSVEHDAAALVERLFNPLHCGAVVASREVVAEPNGAPFGFVQSPSLRGSGRFSKSWRGRKRPTAHAFNPLHCGAVVASLPRTTPSSLFGVLLRKRRLPCDHIICTRLPF